MTDPFDEIDEQTQLNDDLFEDQTELESKPKADIGYRFFIASLWFAVLAPPVGALIAGNMAALLGIMIVYTIIGMVGMMFALLAFG